LIQLSDKELFKTISEVDVDNSGRVSFEKFLEIYYQKKILPAMDSKK
jgi:Ca2+-binding EF-hand superfamily protein